MNDINSQISGAQILAAAFRRHGITDVFGQSIPSAFHLEAPAYGMKQTAYRQENTGGAMADGYARIARRIGVVTAQNGPAATLLVAPLAEALKASVPVLALVQDVSTLETDKNAFQEIDHLKLFDACTKWVRRVEQLSRLDDYVDMAIAAATSGRPGPVALIVPANLFVATMERQGLSRRESILGEYPLDRCAADPARVEAAADMIAAAECPIIVAGGGVHSSDASQELSELQEAAHIAVGTTAMGKGGVDETHPLSLGVIGYAMGAFSPARPLEPFIKNADLVVLVGNRTNFNGTDAWNLYSPTTRFIHIDIDSLEVSRNFESYRLVGDAKLTLSALKKALLARDLGKRRQRRKDVEGVITRARKDAEATLSERLNSTAFPLRPERLMRDIGTVMDADTIIAADASYSSVWVACYLTGRNAGARFIMPRGLAGLGWGVPLAIGAKVARPQSTVIAVVGDGGFGHSWSELETIVRMKLPIIVIVLNNGVLGYQKHAELAKFGAHTDECHFVPVDHAAIARACGCEGVTIDKADAFLPALRTAIAGGKPALLDVITEPEAWPPVALFEQIEKRRLAAQPAETSIA